jgi:hypothetical protein
MPPEFIEFLLKEIFIPNITFLISGDMNDAPDYWKIAFLISEVISGTPYASSALTLGLTI